MNYANELITRLGTPISGLSADSRNIAGATAFLAYPGENRDGRCYINEALQAGTAGVFWEKENFSWRSEWRVPNVAVDNLRMQCGYLADAVYGEPSRHLPTAAITGTNGKTTVAYLTVQLLQGSDMLSGFIGTLGAGFMSQLAPLQNTTPDAVVLHRWLRRLLDAKAQAAVLEASSHGIVQGRLNGIRLAAAVMTNAAQDHLDYHGTIEKYWQAKAQLFEIPDIGAAILNADDAFCQQLQKRIKPPLLTYGKAGDALRLCSLAGEADGWRVAIDGVLGRHTFYLPLAGVHNVYNFLAAALTAYVIKESADDIINTAAKLILPPGRLQQISSKPAVYIDYAHTPAAMEAVLTSVRATVGNGRLIAVFGAGGGRDMDKRAAMGRSAAAIADINIVTDDNPRHEEAAAIRKELCRYAPAALNIAERGEAIAAALEMAGQDDTIVILGKGHETTQQIGDTLMPFSDAAVVAQQLEKK